MIIGIGTDICEVARIARTIGRFGDRFLDRLFTPDEIAKAKSRASLAPTLAKRFAAKEACAKALGTGMNAGVFWRDIGVVNDLSGKPTLKLTGGALERLKALTPHGMTTVVHLALTDEKQLAQAFVVIEAVAG